MKNNQIVIDEKSHFDETCHFSDERTISKDKAKKEVNNSEKAYKNYRKVCIFASMKRLFFTLCSILCLLNATAGELIESQLNYRRYTTNDGLPQMQAEIIWQDAQNYIYIGTLSGFVRFDGKSFTPFLKGRRENIVGFTEVDGKVSALGFRRQWQIKCDEVEQRQLDPKQEWLLNNFNACDLPPRIILLENRQEQQRRLCRFDHAGPQPFLKSHLFDLMTPDRKLYMDTTGIYVPTENGLYVIRNRQAQRLTVKQDIFTLIRQGNTLYALAADGIYTLSAGKLRPCRNYHFKSPDYGLFVRQNKQGQLIIADSHTIYLYDKGHIRILANGFNMIKGLLVDTWNRLWVATYQGVYCFFHMNFTNHRLTDSDDIARAITFDAHGDMIVGTLNGVLLKRHEDIWTEINSIEGNYYAPNAVTIGDQVFMAGNGDIACYDGHDLQWLRLPKDRYQFVAQAGKRLIIGSRRNLLAYEPDNQEVDTLSTAIPHPWTAAEDAQGRLWVGSSFGLFCIDDSTHQKDFPQKLVITTMERDQLGNIFFASSDSLFLIRNGEVEDLTSQIPALTGNEIRSLHISPRGYLIIATISRLFIGRIDNNYQIGDIHCFDHTNGFTALEPLKATMAEAPDGTVWMAGVEEMTSFLPASLLDDNQQSTIIPVPLEWWQRWWVWVIALTMLAFFIWRLARRYEIRRSQQAMRQLYREKRQKELQLNTIRLKAIPHFHSNVMAGIEYFMMNNSNEEATRYLKLYSDFTNQTLADLDCSSQTIEEELDYIKNYLELEQLRYGERLQYDIQVSDKVDRQAHLPTMLLHTYCQNAIKHGIGNKENGGRIDIIISQSQDDDTITVQVKDNGVGRAEAARMTTNSTKMGLKILMEQISLYNQSNQNKIRHGVTDLFDEKGRPAGTCYEMTIPINYQYE